jgi:hypothetical protein
LGSGNHTLTSTPGQIAGFNIDQLVLTSAAGAGPRVSAPGAPPAPATPPSVVVASQTSTTMQLKVSGVTPGTAPFELVMGQSINAGWVATINGHSLGSPQLIDGFANGWRVDPATLGGAAPGGAVTVDLRWTPQARVNLALVTSALAILVCLLLAILPLVRRRTRGSRDTIPADDDAPQLARLITDGPRTPVAASVIVAVVVGVVAGAITLPVTGIIVGAVTLLTLRVPRLRVLLAAAAVGCVLAAGVFVVARQGVDHILAGGSWPSEFGWASTLTWAGIVFLGADATVEIVRRWGSPSPDPYAGSSEPPA